MRKFSSYGQIDTELHYYAPRTELIEKTYKQLVGESPEKGGHYITIWAPRQTGKSTVMLEVTQKIREHETFDVVLMSMQSAKTIHTTEEVLQFFVKQFQAQIDQPLPVITTWREIPDLFTSQYFSKPLILIIDEFDALDEEFINGFANEFRDIYINRRNETSKASHEKTYLLHGLALIGVRSVLGIENVTGSPFNVQRSVHIPNLTCEEVEGMFQWYQRESGQAIEVGVIERVFYETQGHPGLTCWFGELLTEEYNSDITQPLTMAQFDYVLLWATQGLPNNTVLNILSKAKQSPYKETVLEIFKTEEKMEFKYDDPHLNFLYLNGVIAIESTPANLYVKFASPFVQKRLFQYFSGELFRTMGTLVDPFDSLQDVIVDDMLLLPNLIARYQTYLKKNSGWLFKEAPRRRTDLRIFEAVYHFNFYMYLHKFLRRQGARVWPEFPTGNGKLDILILYRERMYGIEVKAFGNVTGYKEALTQAAEYGLQLGLTEITLVFFIEVVDEDNRKRYEQEYQDAATGVTVKPVFIETGG